MSYWKWHKSITLWPAGGGGLRVWWDNNSCPLSWLCAYSSREYAGSNHWGTAVFNQPHCEQAPINLMTIFMVGTICSDNDTQPSLRGSVISHSVAIWITSVGIKALIPIPTPRIFWDSSLNPHVQWEISLCHSINPESTGFPTFRDFYFVMNFSATLLNPATMHPLPLHRDHLTFPMLKLLSSKAQGHKDFWKTS